MEVLEFLKTSKNYGYGSGYGGGSGDGDGYGSGYSYGGSDGYDYGHGIKSINKKDVCLIDNIETILAKIKNNVARGFVLNKDLSQIPCYVVKKGNIFAHGKNLKEAKKALLDKIFKDLSEDERIDAFLDNFKLNVKYPVMDFYDWHNKLTGSCELGRQTFCKNHNIDLQKDKLTVNDFINLCIDDYGSDVIQLLKNKIEEF